MLKGKLTKVMVLFALLLVTTYAAKKVFVHVIDQKVCTQCGDCIKTCPENAIKAIKKNGKTIHEIDPALCTQCGICIDGCPIEAITAIEKKDAVSKK